MKKCLLIGYRGFGDWLYAVPILEHLFKEYDVFLDTSGQGWELFHDDERFASKTFFDIHKMHMALLNGQPIDELKIVNERWEYLIDLIKPDKVVNLFRTFESAILIEKYQPEFYDNAEDRRTKFGKNDPYKEAFKVADIPFSDNFNKIGLFYPPKQIEWAERWKNKHKDDFIIMMAVSGSGFHKKYPRLNELIDVILSKYENSVIYLVGSEGDHIDFTHERVYDAFGQASFKQIVLMAKYADLVIGPETGLHVAAGMWDTPKIQFCNMGSVEQLCKYHKNDYSIQSKCPCSPCHKMVQDYLDCDNLSVYNYKLHPSCILEYDENEIMQNIEKVYEGKVCVG